MQASVAAACPPPGGGPKPEAGGAPPVIGAAPCEGNGLGAPSTAVGAAPFTAGNGEAPCAAALPIWHTTIWAIMAAAASGAAKRRMVKMLLQTCAEFNERMDAGDAIRARLEGPAIYDSCRRLTTC